MAITERVDNSMGGSLEVAKEKLAKQREAGLWGRASQMWGAARQATVSITSRGQDWVGVEVQTGS